MTPATPDGSAQRPVDRAAEPEMNTSMHSGADRAENAGMRPTHRFLRRAVGIAVAIASIFGLSACASLDAPGFSGGGVPIGGSRLFGRVVAAANPSVSLSNVMIDVQATPAGGAPIELHATTGPSGNFNFANVLPGFSNGIIQVTAVPNDSSFRMQRVAFSVVGGHTEQMILTLPPATFDPSSAHSLSLMLASSTVPSGGTVQVDAVIRDAQGKEIALLPTLVFDGNFGTLNANGSFTVPKGVLSGTGSISAYWLGLQPETQQIQVGQTAQTPPPDPPDVTKSRH